MDNRLIEQVRTASNQRAAVELVMRDGQWHTPYEITEVLRAADRLASESAITARLRDFRKRSHGGRIVEARRKPSGRGAFEYRLGDQLLPGECVR